MARKVYGFHGALRILRGRTLNFYFLYCNSLCETESTASNR